MSTAETTQSCTEQKDWRGGGGGGGGRFILSSDWMINTLTADLINLDSLMWEMKKPLLNKSERKHVCWVSLYSSANQNFINH